MRRPRLLPGEDLGRVFSEDAEHWCAVYGELLDFVGAQRAELDRTGRGQAQEAAVLGQAEEGYRRRWEFWDLRRHYLELWAQHQELARRLRPWTPASRGAQSDGDVAEIVQLAAVAPDAPARHRF